MPPRPKFDRQEIVEAAFAIARESGMDAVTARAVGERLGCSPRPIFTFFRGMEELRRAAAGRAGELFEEYLAAADAYNPAFKKRGLQFVRFAQEEPALFRLLFMVSGEKNDLAGLLRGRICGFEDDVGGLCTLYGLERTAAERIFLRLWVSAYGLCVLCASGLCFFTDAELASLLGEEFAGAMMLAKSGERAFTDALPAPKDSPEGEKLVGAFADFGR